MNNADSDLILVECRTVGCGNKFDLPFDALSMMSGGPGCGAYCGCCGRNNGFKAIQDPSPTTIYATLLKVVRELAACNHLCTRNVWDWPTKSGYDYQLLNDQAKKLEPAEINIFVDGEDTEAASIAKKYNILPLHRFLNHIFDGPLLDQVIYAPEPRK